MEDSILKSIIDRKKKQVAGRPHTFIIKKDIKRSKLYFDADTTPMKVSHIKIHPRSKSQNRPQNKSLLPKSPPQIHSLLQYIPQSRQNIKDRELMTGLSTSRKKHKSVEHKSYTVNAQKSTVYIHKQKEIILSNYIEFIRGDRQQDYVVKADFGVLRKRGKRDGLQEGDKKVLKYLRTIFMTISENLTNPKTQSSLHVQQSCVYYLQCHQKSKLQVLLPIHYPRALQFKLRPYLVYQRQLIYYVYILSKSGLLPKLGKAQIESVKLSAKYIRECLQLLMEPIFELQGGAVSRINEAFRTLKAVGEVEKKLIVVERQMRRMQLRYIRTHRVLIEIQSQLRELIYSKDEWPLQRLTEVQMQISWRYFQIPPVPYLPIKPQQTKPYTLIVQLDLTLIYYDQQNKILKYRPYIDIFLTKLKEAFQIVLYTSATHEYTDRVVVQIQKVGKYFDYVLCESHLVMRDGQWVKDFARLGRDPGKLVIVDSNRSQNGGLLGSCVQVSEWRGKKEDKTLHRLTNVLWDMYLNKPEDVRQYFRTLNSTLHSIEEGQEEKNQQLQK